MGDRADFYVGVGRNAEWIGSVGWNGFEWLFSKIPAKKEKYPWINGNACTVMDATTESEFRTAVSEQLGRRKDATHTDMGWPWPWADSSQTDFAYCFVHESVHVYRYGSPYDEKTPIVEEWPDMSPIMKVVIHSPRSGLIVL